MELLAISVSAFMASLFTLPLLGVSNGVVKIHI